MALDPRIQALAAALSGPIKKAQTQINGNMSDLSALNTAAKTNLVAAINEVLTKTNATINDTAANNVVTSTYSASKISSLIDASAVATKNSILGGASAAYDTLKELQDAIASDESNISAIMTALGLRVRVDIANQGLTATQMSNARTNIGAVAAADIGNTDTDYVAIFLQGLT